MKELFKISVLFIILAIFTGCASSGVIPMDNGVYYISKSNARVGMGPPSPDTISAVYKEANDFCKTKNGFVALQNIKIQFHHAENSTF